MSNIKIFVEILLNIETWKEDQLDSRGIYKELITSERLYRVYSYGEIYMIRNNKCTLMKKIILEEKENDIIVKSYY